MAARRHGVDGELRRGPEVRTPVAAGAVDLDPHGGPPGGFEVREKPRLVLVAAPPDDVEFGVRAHWALGEAGHHGELELGQVLAG